MEKLRKFETEEQYLNEKESLEYPCVSLTDDNGKVWVKEEENYILVTYKNKINNDDDLEYIFDDENHCYVSNWFYVGDPSENEKIIPSFIEREELISINEDNSATYKLHLKDYAKSDGVNFKGVFGSSYGSDGAIFVPILSLDFSKANIKILDKEMQFTFSIPYIKEIIFGNNFDTSNVTDMSGMFYYCSKLTSIEFGNKFDTSNVINMQRMFENCTNLTSITFGNNFNTSKVTNMIYMFDDCRSLTSLNLSSFNTSKVTYMNYMFNLCSRLTSLDLSGWDISKVEDGQCAFNDVNNDVVIGVDPTLDIFICVG